MKAKGSVVYVLAMVFLLGPAGIGQRPVRPRTLPFPEVRLGPNGEGAEGELWLSWSEEKRLGFANGFVQGYVEGWRGACYSASSDNKVVWDCQAARGDLVVSFESLRNMATHFYSAYPEDRALPIDRLLRELIKPGMTIERVHEWLDTLVLDSQRAPPTK
jgi:hypothetical protein